MPEETFFMTRETHCMSKEAYFMSKETYFMQKEAYSSPGDCRLFILSLSVCVWRDMGVGGVGVGVRRIFLLRLG